MKRILLLAVVVGAFSGCATFQQAVSEINTGLAGMAKASEESIRLAPALEFSMLYASYGVLGTMGLGGGEFPVGTGVTYEVTDDSNTTSEFSRAKLAPGGAGGFWWALSVKSEDVDMYYEFLTDRNDNILKVRYRDPDTGEISEFIPDQDSEETTEAEQADYKDYVVGRERITTPAGTYNAEKVVFNNDEDYTLTYWVASSVPGGTVKYIAEDHTDGTTATSELIEIKKGYATTLNSY